MNLFHLLNTCICSQGRRKDLQDLMMTEALLLKSRLNRENRKKDGSRAERPLSSLAGKAHHALSKQIDGSGGLGRE